MSNLITILGKKSFINTVESIIALIKERKFTIFSRIDHAEAAQEQGLQLRPTELLIFGNPKIGTFLMQDQQSCGIDLPVKILVWQDESGEVKISFNKMEGLKSKHQLTEESLSILEKIEDIVSDICHTAAN